MNKNTLAKRFRGLLPVIIDVETSGLNTLTDAILEIAMVTIVHDENGRYKRDKTFAYHVEPFIGAHIDPEALAVNRIDPTQPLRYAIPEQQALHRIFNEINKLLVIHDCKRGILVGHNAWFDLQFIQAAVKRCGWQNVPLHSFTSLDTASIAAITLGETVLAKATKKAGISFDVNQAHSAIYDAEKTADLFCYIVNRNPLVR